MECPPEDADRVAAWSRAASRTHSTTRCEDRSEQLCQLPLMTRRKSVHDQPRRTKASRATAPSRQQIAPDHQYGCLVAPTFSSVAHRQVRWRRVVVSPPQQQVPRQDSSIATATAKSKDSKSNTGACPVAGSQERTENAATTGLSNLSRTNSRLWCQLASQSASAVPSLRVRARDGSRSMCVSRTFEGIGTNMNRSGYHGHMEWCAS
jgi:hypothetical protein